MATKPPGTKASAKEVQIAINNAISTLLGSEDGPPETRMRRLAQYTRAFYEPMKQSLLEEEMLRPPEAVAVLLCMALMTQQSVLVEAERKVPAQQVLNILFNEEGPDATS